VVTNVLEEPAVSIFRIKVPRRPKWEVHLNVSTNCVRCLNPDFDFLNTYYTLSRKISSWLLIALYANKSISDYVTGSFGVVMF